MASVLVIGDDLRSFLAVVRSMGRMGHTVHVAPFDFTSPALTSRHIAAIHHLPPYALRPEAWLAAVQDLCAAHHYALIIPCDDRSVLPLHAHRADVGAPLALPNDAAMAVFFDKVATRDLATACGVPVAEGGAATQAEAARLGLPLAIKPRRSMDLGDIGARHAVRIVRDSATLATALAAITTTETHFLERFFPGEGVGLSVLAQHGAIVDSFQHRRLHEASETGGSSSRVSVPVHPGMIQAVAALAAETQLHGVAMFEFRHNRATDAFVLLEVNARFWGSLPLAIASGVDFPRRLFEMLSGAPCPPLPPYATGVVRHDLSGEYYRIVHASERAGGPMAQIAQVMRTLPPLFLRMRTRPARFDGYATDDMAPWQAERRRVEEAFASAVRSRLGRPRAVPGPSVKRAVAGMLATSSRPHIMFVCYGNICRSPFAARLLARKLGDSAHVTSAGTLLREGRPAPDEAAQAARAHDIDLTTHRSQHVDVAAAQAADALFVFDPQNAQALAQLGVPKAKIIELGALIGAASIADPYGRGDAAFADCYAQIDAATDEIAAMVTK